MEGLRGTFWPSPLQAALLRVALDDRPEAAVKSWQELRPSLDVEILEPGSFELMPLVYRNLTGAGVDDPELGRLKGIVRRTWVRNNLLGERTKAAAEALAAGDVPALFIEGVALASRFYPELGLRPTSFIDVLVNGHDCQPARTRLADLGWKTAQGTDPGVPGEPRHLVDQHGNVCVLRSTIAIDLITERHREPFDPVWDTWHRLALFGADVCVPPPTETLFAVVVSNARWKSRKSLQWIVDAKAIIGAGIDWNRLFELGEATGQVLRLREACIYLAGLPGAKPPAELHERLSNVEVTRRERFFYFCTTGPVPSFGNLPGLLAEHVGASGNRTHLGTLASFPGFLRDHWNLAHTWEVPIAAGRRALGRLGARRKQPGAGTGGADS